IGRGEIFEAIDALAFLRKRVLGPLALLERGELPAGVRRIEKLAPEYANSMRRTSPGYSALSCAEALQASADLYRQLRSTLGRPDLVLRTPAEEAALAYLMGMKARCVSEGMD